MRKLLVPLLLVPALALAQVPMRPPKAPPGVGPTGKPARPMTRPTREPPAQAEGQAPASPPPGAQAQQPPPPPPVNDSAPTPAGEGTVRLTGDKCQPMKGRFMLSFNKADIVDVLEQASRWTCRNFIYTEEVARGKITLLSKTPVTADEAYAAFLAALNSNNLTLYPTGRYWKLSRSPDGKKLPIPTYVDPGTGTPSTEQIITKVIRLQNSDADQLRGVLGNFISPQGADIQSIPPDTLIITDIGLNIRRIEKMLETIDRAGAGDTIRIVQIRYASAKDIADKLNQIFAGQQVAGKARRGVTTTSPAGPTGRPPGPVPAPSPPGAAPAAPGGTTDGAGGGAINLTKVLADDRTNKLIVIADEKSFQRLQELVEQLDVPTSADGGIHVIFLKNANAEELATTLSNLAQGQAKKPGGPGTSAVPAAPMPGPLGNAVNAARPAGAGGGEAATAELFSGDVKITSDKTQNALLVQASGADFNTISRLVERLDRPRRQVFVEAVILEVNLQDQNQVGVGMHAAVPYKYKGETGIIPFSSNPGRVNSLDATSAIGLGGFLTGYVGPTTAELKDFGLSIPSIGVLIQALQSNSDVNVISTPQLLAMDNEDSEITVGQNVPFQAGYAPSGLSSALGNSGTSTALGSLVGTGGLNSLYAPIQRQNVELRLKIKPQINEGGNVRLIIEEQTEEIVSQDATLGPTTAKRAIKTQIVAADQSTIVIGGLIQDRNVKSVKKVPVLGSLPVLGWLFRDTTSSKQKTNLLLFLTPYIIRSEADYRRIYEKKRKEQQDFIEQYYGRTPSYRVDVDFSRKAGPYAHLRSNVAEETGKLENGGQGLPGEGQTTPPGGGDTSPAPATPATPPSRTTPVNPTEPQEAAPPPEQGEALPQDGAPAEPDAGGEQPPQE
ncbi:MAG: type II secretion system secretin GspD [Anaeromyxobacter sp.]